MKKPVKMGFTGNHVNFCLQLTHDLMSHYIELGTQLKDKNDANNAKDMFFKNPSIMYTFLIHFVNHKNLCLFFYYVLDENS